jgi:8-oxo-dGTP pyrophosphatase MutT (NUDIX family)
VRSDLVTLKEEFLPSLGSITASTNTDYRYRATAPKADVAAAMAKIVGALDYDNFKNAVAKRQGQKRAKLYHDVWDVLYTMQGDASWETAAKAPKLPAPTKLVAESYGGVLINARGEVLLREPSGHFGGYVWTFAKGQPDKGETPEQTALREVFEETGYPAKIVAVIPQVFGGTTRTTVFYLMKTDGEPQPFHSETSQVRWVDESEAKKLISLTKTDTCRQRDLAVLDAALKLWKENAP